MVYRQLAQALRRAVDQHGVPNRFGLAELHRLYGGPRPLDVGRLTRYGLKHEFECAVIVYLGLCIDYEKTEHGVMIRVSDSDGRFVKKDD